MPHLLPRSIRESVCIGAFGFACCLPCLKGAPGDFTIEIIARTGDPNSGPNQQAFNAFTYGAYLGGGHPVSIDDRGYVTFSASSGSGESSRNGIYQFTSQLRTIADSQTSAPGVTKNGDPIPFKSVPWRAYTSSPDGKSFAFTTYIDTGLSAYLYSATDQAIDASPITYPDYLTNSILPKGRFNVSDARGTVKEIIFGKDVGVLAMNNRGDIAWRHNGEYFRTQRQSSGASPITALAYANTAAPGFAESENATFNTLRDLLGLDAAGNTYFIATVNGTTLNSLRAVYRLAADSADLTLVYASGIHTLPGWADSSSLNFEADDILPMEDGSVILRLGTTGSNTGFWKAKPDGSFELLAFFSEFTPTPTDQGDLGFRSVRVDYADFAVGDDGSIFFTADVRFGVNAINQEGVWLIDPVDSSIKTIARADTDAPGTDAKFGAFSAIAADGPSYVAFMSQLSDGKNGLFLTNRNSQVVAIAIEGQTMDGSTIETIHFTPDHAGQDLGDNHDAAGLNAYGDLAFTADLANGTTVLVRAAYERQKPPEGNVYKWNGQADGLEWHDLTDQLSNWEDASGTRWNNWPNSDTAEVFIDSPNFVQLLDSSVTISSIQSTGTIELLKNLTILNDASLADLTLETDSKITLQGSVTFDGELTSWKDGLTFRPSSPDATISTSGTVSTEQLGIDAQATSTIDLTNHAAITSTNGDAIHASSENGDVIINNTGSLTARKGKGLVATAPNGSVFISSPSPSSPNRPNIIGGFGSGIYANAKDAIVVEFNGEVTASGTGPGSQASAIRAESSAGSVNINSQGKIDAYGTVTGIGLLGTGSSGVEIRHQGTISTDFLGVFGKSLQSDVNIDMTQAEVAAQGGVFADAPNGSVSIKAARIGSNSGNGINALAKDDINILANGPINVIDAQAAIYANSSAGNITINSTAKISGTGITNPGIAFFTKAYGNIDIKHSRGSINTDASAFSIESTNGDITVDARATRIGANWFGYQLTALEGAIKLWSGETHTGEFSAIDAQAKGPVEIIHNGEINTIGNNINSSSFGILATSTESSISIKSHGEISTTHSGPSSAIYANSYSDTDIQSSGDLSTFKSTGILATSSNGSITIAHDGYIAATHIGSGLSATAKKGSVIINLKNGSVDARNEGESNVKWYGVAAFADQSVSIVSTSSVHTYGEAMTAIHAEATNGGASVLLNAEISPYGSNSDGVSLNSPTQQTLTLAGGSITGTDGSATAVRFNAGATNLLTNKGSIGALNFIAIRGDTGNETIENYATISGNILLGSGTNSLHNHNKAILYPETAIEIGADNAFTNDGTLIAGNDESTIATIAVTGNYTQSSSGITQLKILSPTTNDSLAISGAAQLAGSLVLQIPADLDATTPIQLNTLTADSISSTFERNLPTSIQNLTPAAIAAHARQFPSRNYAVELSYSGTAVQATLSSLTIENYQDWESHYFSQPASQDPEYAIPLADSNPTDDPDHDGLSNLEEYVYGTHPLFASASPLQFDLAPQNLPSDGVSHFSFPWANDVKDYRWQIESSPNFKDWTPETIEPTSTTQLGEITAYSFVFKKELLPKFVRIRIIPSTAN